MARRLAAAAVGLAASLGVVSEARALNPARAIHQYVSHSWNVDSGLPQNSVKGIAQTPDGYLWLGTEEGLVRFDGIRFTIFNEGSASEISGNDMDAMCTDGAGTLWVAAREGGLIRYADGKLRTFHEAEGIASDILTSIACGGAEEAWVGSPKGLLHYLRGTITKIGVADGLPGESVSALTLDPDGTVWVGTDRGLAKVAGGTASTVALPRDPVTAVYQSPKGALLVGTRGRVRMLEKGAWVAYGAEEGLPEHDISALLVDRDENLWVGFREGGLRRRTPAGKWSAYIGEQGLAGNVVGALFEDREGNLWVGWEGDGAERLTNPKVVTYSKNDGITGALVWSVFEDRDERLWIGTRAGGVHRRSKDGTIVTYTKKDGLPADTVFGIDQDPQGNMWFATEGGGVARLDEANHVTVLSTKEGIASDWVRAVHADHRGNVWIGTEGGGLDLYRDGKITHFGQSEWLASETVRTISEDATGTVWFGTEGGGVARYEDGKFSAIRKKDGLSDDSVVSVARDDDGALWFGTYHGLTRYKDGKYKVATTKQGLFNDTLYAALFGNDDRLYMPTNMGISSISREDFEAYARGVKTQLSPEVFGKADGMKIAECNGGSPAAVRGKDGKLWFANGAGAVMLDPSAIKKNPVPPPVLIESMEVDHKDLPLRLLRDRVELAPGARDFEFRYTALSFAEPERVRFKYKLEGFDKDWVDAGARRTAYYTNLSHGDYRFRVIAANNDGVWNEAGAELALRLAPHFYETVPFYVGVGAFALLLGGAIFRLRVAQLRAHARELERKVQERTRELGLANRELAAKDLRISQDLEQARAFQQGILPKLPSMEGLRFGVVYRPADLVGGDIYDIVAVGEKIRVFIADTTGHGVQASLRTMVLRTEYDALKRTSRSPAQLLCDVNRRLFERYPDLELRSNALCFDIERNGAGGARVTFANAAQPPLLHATNSHVAEVYEPGPFLAMMEEIEISERAIELAPGDRLLAYTDGVYEQENRSGEPFGFERMTAIFADKALDAGGIVEKLRAEVEMYAGGPLEDDVTIVCIEAKRPLA